MKTFLPKIQVLLFKASARAELAPGVAANKERYGALKAIDLTPFLSEQGGVRVSKMIRNPMGAFSFSLADKMMVSKEGGIQESLYGLIEPMDLIEIRLAHNTADYASTGRLPIVMRGFVSNIRRSESMSGGRPSRMVHVTGNDYGKALQILRIYYLMNTAIGDSMLSELKFFQKFASGGAAKIMSAQTFVQLVLDNVINPYLAKLTGAADGSTVGAGINGTPTGANVITSIKAEVSIPGIVSPLGVSSFDGGSVWDFLASYLDIGSFNELFLDDREDGIVLVVRPNPFLDVSGQPIQAQSNNLAVKVDKADLQRQLAVLQAGLDAEVAKSKALITAGAVAQGQAVADAARLKYADDMARVTAQIAAADSPSGALVIDAVDVEALDASRGDDGVANYYWVTNDAWQLVSNLSMQQLSQQGSVADYAPLAYDNCAVSRFGFRKMEVSSSMGPGNLNNSDATPAAAVNIESNKLLGWLDGRRTLLAKQNKDNVVFERGSMRLRGNEKIKAGTYLAVRRGSVLSYYYIVHVDHTFMPFQSFKTTVMFERGTGFIDRAQSSGSPYLAELSIKGAV